MSHLTRGKPQHWFSHLMLQAVSAFHGIDHSKSQYINYLTSILHKIWIFKTTQDLIDCNCHHSTYKSAVVLVSIYHNHLSQCDIINVGRNTEVWSDYWADTILTEPVCLPFPHLTHRKLLFECQKNFCSKELPKIVLFTQKIAIGNFWKNDNIWQFFFKCQVLCNFLLTFKLQFSEGQIAIARKVLRSWREIVFNVLTLPICVNYKEVSLLMSKCILKQCDGLRLILSP